MESELKQSKVFCMLPWTHLHVRADGNVYPCCNWDPARPLGSTQHAALKSFWNSEEVRRLRLNMLRGLESPGCANCYLMERIGNPATPRLTNIKRFWHHFPLVETTRSDGTVEEFNMPYVDIRFSNLCNFRCRSCGPDASSSWHEDHVRLTGEKDFRKFVYPTTPPEDLWRQIEPLIPHIEYIYFAGGEPLITDGHYRLLQALIRLKKFDVPLSYSTNFSTFSYQGQDVMELWDQFKDVELCASLDGMGRQGEYLRKNQVWAQVLRDRERLARVCPRVLFQVKPVLTAMNVLHLPDFHAELLRTGFVEPGNFHLTIAVRPREYSIQILPPRLKSRVVERYNDHIHNVLLPVGHMTGTEVRSFESALRFLLDQDKTEFLETFRERTRQLDEMRGEDFASVFPELADLMSDTGCRIA